MSTLIKRQFQLVLKSNCIPYQTFKHFTKINSITISYDDDLDTITFRDAAFSKLSLTTPYCTPATLLGKLLFFQKVAKRWRMMTTTNHIPLKNIKTYNHVRR